MVSDLLSSPNPMVKYGTAAFIVFAPLYIASSYGFRAAGIVAGIVLLLVIKANAGKTF